MQTWNVPSGRNLSGPKRSREGNPGSRSCESSGAWWPRPRTAADKAAIVNTPRHEALDRISIGALAVTGLEPTRKPSVGPSFACLPVLELRLYLMF